MNGAERVNPFPGLRPFKQEESHLFFGREGQSEELLNRLHRNRFVAVVGTSGSGKSSLVRAGLLPIVHGGFMANAGSHWRVAVLRPGDNPIGNLAEALSRPDVLKLENSPGKEQDIAFQIAVTEAALRRGSLGLVQKVRQSGLPKVENLLVVVDQFEELFRFKESARVDNASDEAAAFVKLLLKAAGQEEVPIYVVITMRSEYLGVCAQFRDLPETINNSQYLIPRMTRDQRRQAITGPAAVAGAEISQPLIQRLLNDMGDNPDQLPILQHALMRTWDYWAENHEDGDQLDLEHYQAIGAMERALSRHAEEAYEDLKNERDKTICKQMFKLLTDRGETGHGIRRPVKVNEICRVTEASEEEVIKVIDVFRRPGRTFLMPPIEEKKLKPDSVIDISHESFMRIWTRLKVWVREEARSAELYRRLSETSALYEKGEAGLWGDPDLLMALKWYDENNPNEAWAERYDPSFDRAIKFLEASEKQQESKKKIKKNITVIMAILAAASIVFGVLAWINMNKAQKSEQVAIVAKIDMEIALKSAKENEQEAIKQKNEANVQKKIAQEQNEIAEKKEKEAINARISAVRNWLRAEMEKSRAKESAIKEEIQKLIAGMNKEEADFLQYLTKAKELAVISTAEAKDKELKALLALTAYDVNLKAYERLEKSSQDTEYKFDQNKLAEFSERKKLVDAYEKLNKEYEKLRTISAGKSVPPEIFAALRAAYIANNKSKDILYKDTESWALAVTAGNRIVFNNRRGELLSSFIQLNNLKLPVIDEDEPKLLSENVIQAVSLARGGDRLFCGARDGKIFCLESDKGASQIITADPKAKISAMAFSRKKNCLLYSLKDIVYIHDLKDTSKPITILKAKKEGDNFLIRALAVIEDDDSQAFLIAAGEQEQGNIFYWDLSEARKKEKKLNTGFKSSGFYTMAYHPHRKWLASGNESGEIHLFKDVNSKNLRSGTNIQHKKFHEEHKGIVKTTAFSPDGRYLASGGLDGTVLLWDLKDKEWKDIDKTDTILTINNKRKILSLNFIKLDSRGEGEIYLIFSDEKDLHICPTKPETFYEKLCRGKSREFKEDEWKQYVGESIKQQDIAICSSKKEKK